jgi:hypothetical protein
MEIMIVLLRNGYWPIVKTNIHSIHAGLERGPEFLPTYLLLQKISMVGSLF